MLSVSNQAAIHSIDHFTLAVPALDVARNFFTAFGLQVEECDAGLLLRTKSGEHVWGQVIADDAKHLAYLSFNCYEADFATLVAQVTKARAVITSPHPRARYREGLWFEDPEGNLLQLRVGPKKTPDVRSDGGLIPNERVGRGVTTSRAQAERVHPTRLSHVLLFTADVDAQVRFYAQVLGLGLSDRSADIIAFMHGCHGSDHHLVAFAKSHRRGWHHSSWDVPNVEHVGHGWMQMQAAGFTRAWGLGRHVLGSNYFCYIEDPWGSFCEYSADMDFVPEGFNWPAGDHPVEDSLYLWGPPPLPNFVTNTEVATTSPHTCD
jgi:catechol-2,3-dioxygenase